MYIFIDESGIHKRVDNSSFILVYIEAKHYQDLEKSVQKIEQNLNIDYFHWAETIWKVKEKFMDEALKLDFLAKIAIISNPVNPAKELERVLIHMMIEKNIKNVYIDGKKPKWYAKRIKKILRDKGISIRKLRTIKNNQFGGIRVADMVAGLARSYYDKKNLEKIEKYYNRLKKKIVVIIE